jgi:hypothetical protein
MSSPALRSHDSRPSSCDSGIWSLETFRRQALSVGRQSAARAAPLVKSYHLTTGDALPTLAVPQSAAAAAEDGAGHGDQAAAQERHCGDMHRVYVAGGSAVATMPLIS